MTCYFCGGLVVSRRLSFPDPPPLDVELRFQRGWERTDSSGRPTFVSSYAHESCLESARQALESSSRLCRVEK